MFSQNRILFICGSFCVLICCVVAFKCDKLRTVDGSSATEDHVVNEGVYHVKTKLKSNLKQLKELADSLQGVSDVKFTRRGFTVTLQPKHIKKLCNNGQILHIKQMKRIKHEVKCGKLLKGNSSYAVQDSYIVTIKDHILSSSSINSIEIASKSIDSSVMIASSTPLHGSKNGFVMKMNDAAVEYICNLPVVDYIEEDQEIGIASSTTPWHLDRIDQKSLPLDSKYSAPNDGSGVDIYIFDTGINYHHTEFDNNRAKYSGIDAIDVLRNQNKNGLDCQGHGTHVAGLAGGKTHGVAKKATLYSVRVLDCNGYGSTSAILVGLNHVIGQVQKKSKKSKKTKAIINMSLTTKNSFNSRSMRDAIATAAKNGILVVAAAGNYESDACQYSPAAFTDVLTVGGTQRTDRLYRTFFYGSNYGSCVDIFAPGQRVESAYHRGRDSYATLDGTSQATPIVSGAAAVYWNMLSDDANATIVKSTLLNTCSKGEIKIAATVPSSFVQQTTNCLLYITKDISKPPPKHNIPIPPPPAAQKVYHNVSFDEIETLIKEMGRKKYALSYLQNYRSSPKNTRYSFIFTYMKNRKFKTLVFLTKQEVKAKENQLHQDFKITYIHDLLLNTLKRFVVVFARNKKIEYKVRLRVTAEKLAQIKANRAAEKMTLYSASPIINKSQKGILHTLLYSNETSTQTQYLYNVKKAVIVTRVKDQLKQGYHLKHLSSYTIKGQEKYALVLHRFAKPEEKYRIAYISSTKLQRTVNKLISEGNTINVVAGIWKPKLTNDVYYLIAYESI